MTEEKPINYKREREEDASYILNSKHKKKVVLAGPGTGKSHLLEQAIKIKREEGRTKFQAITFLGKLRDNLADDLAGLATTTTLHGYARELVLKYQRGWVYHPTMKKIILEDLMLMGLESINVGDTEYLERSQYYKAVGDEDVVFYAAQICKADRSKIPTLDLLLIDEFQDFNEVEDEFICLLAEKSEVIIVGDDDQALYKWKNAHPKYIREKHDESNTDYESHTLRWCTRCPEVVINAFHDITAHYASVLRGRKQKEYLCYYPAKEEENRLNQKINILHSGYTSIARNIRFELEKILKTQKIKSVLIIGEGKSCKSILPTIARYLMESGFRNVDSKSNFSTPFTLNQDMVDGYKYLKKHDNPVLGWRLISMKLPEGQLDELIKANFSNPDGIGSSLSSDFKKEHLWNANTMLNLINGTPSARAGIADRSLERLQENIVTHKKKERELLTDQLVLDNHHLKLPLANLDITVCSIQGSKGLGADAVFLIGFDQGKLPAQQEATDEEVYQLLVALTRTKKTLYLVNTIGCEMSNFLKSMNEDRYEIIQQPEDSEEMIEKMFT